MALNLQHSIIAGRLTKKPELKQTSTGLIVCPFTIAVNLKSGEEQYSEYNECVAYGKTAENIARHFDKGHEILVICNNGWRTREWDGKDGTKHYKTEHKVSDFRFVGNRAAQPSQAPTPNGETAAQPQFAPLAPPAPSFDTISSDEDLPF